MNNIANQFPLTGLSNRQNTPSESYSAGYVKEQSFRSQESLDTDLVIHTKDGDKVTITADSFSQLDAYTYDSKGIVQTQSGSAAYSQNYREITLATGNSFSFSVQGDLDEDELKDLDAMLKGLDGIITDVKDGDMKGAVEGALGLGNFDTFSAYKVDISYQQSYEMSSSMAAVETHTGPAAIEDGDKEASKPGLFNADNFFNKLLKQLDKHDQKLFGPAKNPINKLFQHHLDEMKDVTDQSQSIKEMIEKAMEKVDSFIETMMPELSEPTAESSHNKE